MPRVVPQIVQTILLLSNEHKAILNAHYNVNEIKRALFSIPRCKTPRLDGLGSFFNKDSWDIIQDDVIDVVLKTLQSERMLKELNNTTITLIPKIMCPRNVTEFRPISCCNTLYKCITKVLCNRLRQVLLDIIIENQGGFVYDRFIVHNIMVIQDLVKHYGRRKVKPSCLRKNLSL